MLQIKFNLISHVKIFLVALFHTKHFRRQAARVRTFLTLLNSIFLLAFFYVANSRLDMFCHVDNPFLRLHIFSLFHFFKMRSCPLSEFFAGEHCLCKHGTIVLDLIRRIKLEPPGLRISSSA
jgi:hypothetical protein